MRFLLLLALIGAVGWALLRSLREQRQAWLRRLGLVGTWSGGSGDVAYTLELRGAPDGGSYLERTRTGGGETVERGEWRVEGEALVFRPEAGAGQRCELRFFAPGRIGVHGPGRERRVYDRTADNVVSMRRR